jgi:hypothetical protein
MFRESCSSSYTEHNKIGFAIFGFFYDFIGILQVTGPKETIYKNLLADRTSDLLKLHNHALGFNTPALGKSLPSQPHPPAARQARRRRGRAGGGN